MTDLEKAIKSIETAMCEDALTIEICGVKFFLVIGKALNIALDIMREKMELDQKGGSEEL